MPWTHRAFWIGPFLIAALLVIFSVAVSGTHLRHIYEARLAESRRERLFLASVGFFTAVWSSAALHLRFTMTSGHSMMCRCRDVIFTTWSGESSFC